MLNTLVNKLSIHNGLQSVLFVGSEEHGPLRALVNVHFMHKGVMVKLSDILLNDAQRQELAERQHFYKIVEVL